MVHRLPWPLGLAARLRQQCEGVEEKEQKEPPERSPERPGSEKVSPRRARPSTQRKAPTRSTPELDGVEAPEALRPGLGVRSSGGYREAPETPVTPAVSSTAKPKPSANGARGAERSRGARATV